MAHNHNHNVKNIRLAFFLNIAFTIFEIIGGLFTNSIAILSDALHDLGDSLALGFSWYMEKVAQKGSTKRFSYGYRRFSLLSALVNILVLCGGSVFIILEAIPRLLNPEVTNAPGMVAIAVVGLVVNGIAVLRLKDAKGQNMKVAALHLLEDILGWAAVLVVAIVLLFYQWYILDAILSLVITLYVLVNAIRNFKQTLSLFLQGVPDDIDIPSIENIIKKQQFVKSIHHTHIWSLDGEHHVLTTHVKMLADSDRESIINVKQAIKELAEEHGFYHTTIEIELENEPCTLEEMEKNK